MAALHDRAGRQRAEDAESVAEPAAATVDGAESEQLRDRLETVAAGAQCGDDVGIGAQRLTARTATVVGDDDRARSHLGEHALLYRGRPGERPVGGVDVPHDRGKAQGSGGLQYRRVVGAIRRPKHARCVASLSTEHLDRVLELTVDIPAPGQVRVRERVVAERVTGAQLTAQGRPEDARHLLADHEEGGGSAVAFEHAHECRRIGRRTVVEADRDQLAVGTVQVSPSWPLDLAADRPIERRSRPRRDQPAGSARPRGRLCSEGGSEGNTRCQAASGQRDLQPPPSRADR